MNSREINFIIIPKRFIDFFWETYKNRKKDKFGKNA